MRQFSFREVMPCLAAIFIDVLGFGLVAPLLISLFTSPEHNLFVIASPSLRYTCLGTALALYPLLMFFGTSFIGDLSDVIGRKKTLLFSMMGMVLSFSLMGVGIIVPSLSLFLLGRGLSGLVSASQSVALATISDLSTEENKAIHLSYVALVQCCGFVMGPLLGGALADFAFYTPFFWSALLALLAFFWIAVGFEETFVKNRVKMVSALRFVKVFIEAYRNERIRKLSAVFLMMQIGVGLYLPIILVLFTEEFRYTPLLLGLFNGYLGVSLAIGLLFALPQMLKRFKIEKIVFLSLFAGGAAQLLSSLFHSQLLLWLFAFPLGIAAEVAFSGMFTAFSNAADRTSQGWVMGISVAIMAVAWAIAGFSAQLIPLFGVHALVFLGSICLGFSTFLMKRYLALIQE